MFSQKKPQYIYYYYKFLVKTMTSNVNIASGEILEMIYFNLFKNYRSKELGGK